MKSSVVTKLLLLCSLLLIFSLQATTVLAYEEQCVSDCIETNEDAIRSDCFSEHNDEFGDYCLFDLGIGYANYGSDCLESHGEDYAIDYDGILFFMTVEDFIEEVCDEFDFACQEDMRSEYDDAQYDDPDSAAEACIEDYADDFYDICVEDFQDAMEGYCLQEYRGEYETTCLEEYGSDEPSCYCEDDQLYIEDLDECLDAEQAACYEEGLCAYESGDWCSGFSDELVDAQDSCVSLEEGLCLLNGGTFYTGECYGENDYAIVYCEEELGNYWSTMKQYCFEDEEYVECVDNSGFWSETNTQCYYVEEEYECIEEGNEYVDDLCLEGLPLECYQEGTYFCEDLELCVDTEDMCCEEEGLYVFEDGECAQNEDVATCINEGYYWSEELDDCFEEQEEAECIEQDFFWDEMHTECLETTNEELTNCLEEGLVWINDECHENVQEALCQEEGLQSYELQTGEHVCLTQEDIDCREEQGLLLNGDCLQTEYTNCLSQGLYYVPAQDICVASIEEKNCIEQHYSQTYGSTWVDYLETCFSYEEQGAYWNDMFECVSDYNGNGIGQWVEEYEACYFGEDIDSALACEEAEMYYDYQADRGHAKIFPEDGINCYSQEYANAYFSCQRKGGTFLVSGMCVQLDNPKPVSELEFDFEVSQKLLVELLEKEQLKKEKNILITDCKYFEKIQNAVLSGSYKQKDFLLYLGKQSRQTFQQLDENLLLDKNSLLQSYDYLVQKCEDEGYAFSLKNDSSYRFSVTPKENHPEFEGSGLREKEEPTNPQEQQYVGFNKETSTQEQFYEVFYENNKLNIFATRNDGFVEEYRINLNEGIVEEGLYSRPNAIIMIDEDVLMDLLSSNNLFNDFFKGLISGEIIYELKDSKSFFESIGDFFGSIFGDTNDTDNDETNDDFTSNTSLGSCKYYSEEFASEICIKDYTVEECVIYHRGDFFTDEFCGEDESTIDTSESSCKYFSNDKQQFLCMDEVTKIDCNTILKGEYFNEPNCGAEGSCRFFNFVDNTVDCYNGFSKNQCLNTYNGVYYTDVDCREENYHGLCDDGNECTIDSEVDGECVHKPSADNKICGDGKLCKNGVCV